MSCRVRILFAVLIFAGVQGAAAAPLPCGELEDSGFAACILARTGAQTAAVHAARGDEMIRLFALAPIRIEPEIVVIEFILPKTGRGQLILRDARERRVNRSYSFPRGEFAPLRARLLSLQGDGARLRGAKPEWDYDPGQVCVDGATNYVDAVLHGVARAVRLELCDTVDYSFGGQIADFAAAFEPDCAPIFADESWVPLALQNCLRMRGDRALASLTFVAAERLARWEGGDWPPRDSEIAAGVAPDAVLRIAGSAPVSGRAAMMQAWLAHSQRNPGGVYGFWPKRASARHGTVVVRGTVLLYRDAGTLQAPATQIWRSGADGKPRLQDWRIGAFAKPAP